MTRRRRLSTSSHPPVNDDLLSEILLPRASLVCKRWCRLVSDPRFLRRFRAHHCKPPLLGFFTNILPYWATFNGAVLRPAGDQGHSSPFQVVVLATNGEGAPAFACVCSSESGMWGDFISTAVRSMFALSNPSTLVVGSLYWLLIEGGVGNGILELDLDRQSLAAIDLPPGIRVTASGFTARLWKMNTDCDGVAGWVLGQNYSAGQASFAEATAGEVASNYWGRLRMIMWC